MSTLYWITVLDNLKTLSIVLFGVSITFTIISALLVITDDNGNEKEHHNHIKARNIGCIALIVSLLGVMFIPSEKQLYMIYGVGGTIDYLKENSKAKELPDKCIKALDTWVDNFNKKSNND